MAKDGATQRDLHFSRCHRAAQAVTAILLGCRVEHMDARPDAGPPAFRLEAAAFNDVLTICGSGYQIERELSRLHDVAWNRSQDDRILVGLLYADSTGLEMDDATIDEQFLIGAASSVAVLEHPAARRAIERLAEALDEAEIAGKERIEGSEILAITGLGSQPMRSSLSA